MLTVRLQRTTCWAMVDDAPMIVEVAERRPETVQPTCMTSDMKRCQASPSWTISVPLDFSAIDNGDSWQAHADTRVVYVSSMKVANGGSPVPAAVLRTSLGRSLEPASAGELHQLEESGVVGDAQIIRTPDGFELKGFACIDGELATCVISFEQGDHSEWAVSTWQSLRPAFSP